MFWGLGFRVLPSGVLQEVLPCFFVVLLCKTLRNSRNHKFYWGSREFVSKVQGAGEHADLNGRFCIHGDIKWCGGLCSLIGSKLKTISTSYLGLKV